MIKRIKDIEEIIYYLLKSKPRFKIRLTDTTDTDYNTIKKCFYLNREDIADCNNILKSMPQTPFKIVCGMGRSKRDYKYDPKTKILHVKKQLMAVSKDFKYKPYSKKIQIRPKWLEDYKKSRGF